MLYNFLRGDLGFLPVLRQLLHGDERVTERGRQGSGDGQQSLVSRRSGERALESHSRPLLAISPASICNPFICESPGNSFGPTYAAPPSAYLALSLARPVVVSSVGVPARHRQTRGLSQSITEDLTAPLKKNLPRTERTDGPTRTNARSVVRAAGAASNGGAPFKTRRANRRSH